MGKTAVEINAVILNEALNQASNCSDRDEICLVVSLMVNDIFKLL
jgi:hypothetical protein